MEVKSYKDLDVWRLSMDLVTLVYRHTGTFPHQEKYGLASQLQRAATSVPSNIAEGNSAGYRGAYLRHLGIARGSVAEIETQVLIAQRLGYISGQSMEELVELAERVGKMLTRLIEALRRRVD